MNRTICVKVDIWDTKYKLTQHRNGSISVRMPFTRWRGNSGSLDFEIIKISNQSKVKQVKWFFENNTLVTDDGSILDYYLTDWR